MLFLAVDPFGARRRQGLAQAEIEPLADDETLVTLDRYSVHPDEALEQYDATARDFVVRQSATLSRTIISRREFRNRLGQSMRLAIIALRASTDPADAPFRYLLEDMTETLSSVNEVDLEHADTIAAVNGLAQLAQLGKLPAIDPAVVLAPSTVPQE